MSLNKVMLIGNLGHDPEIRYMPASKRAVTNLSIAMNDSFTDRSGNRQERTDWLTVVAYGKLAEICHQHLRKGRQLYVEGSIRVREYEPTEGGRFRRPEIVASRVQFLGPPPAAAIGANTPDEPSVAADSEIPV
jgi:single-strand DNA-binding protein